MTEFPDVELFHVELALIVDPLEGDAPPELSANGRPPIAITVESFVALDQLKRPNKYNQSHLFL